MIQNKPLAPTTFIIIIMLSTLAQIVADIYIPSLPAITKALATNPSIIQLTLSAFMLGFSISHLFYGPLSDRIGRRIPIIIGLSLTIIGSILCILTTSPITLIIGRLIQGIGCGASTSVGRTVTRDLIEGEHLAKFGSHMGMISVFAIAAAPTLGGYIQHYFNWQTSFLFILIYTSFICILVIKKLPETNRHLNPEATKPNILLRNYFSLLFNKTFMGYALCSTIAYAGLIAYITAGPFLLQSIVGLTPVQFGWLSFLMAAAFSLSAFVNSRYVLKKGIPTMIFYGNASMLCGGITMLLFALLGFINTAVIMLPVAFFNIGASFTFSNAFAGAIHPFPKMAGNAVALFGCLQILGAALTSMVIAAAPANNQIALGLMLAVLGVLAMMSLKYLATTKKTHSISRN